MDRRDHIQQAIELGRRNKEALELIENWCANLRVVNWGGVGLIEAQMGLPIGHKRIECPHATQAGIASSHLEHLAVDFYDRHCRSCQHRVPVRMPNLLVFVERRDREQAAVCERDQLLEDQRDRELAERRRERDLIRPSLNAPSHGVLELINRVDEATQPEDAQILIETAKAAPEAFTGPIREALIRLIEDGGEARSAAALDALRILRFDVKRLVDCALQALARGEARHVAGKIVASGITNEHAALIEPALPALVEVVSSERRYHFIPPEPTSGDTEPLLRAYNVFPGTVARYLQTLLSAPDKWSRILACDAIEAIQSAYPPFGVEMTSALIASVGLPDDDYDLGSAAERAARLLSKTLRCAPTQIDAAVQEALRGASGERQKHLFRVYPTAVGRERYHHDGTPASGEAEQIAFQRILDLIARRPDDDRLNDVLQFLRHDARHWPRLVDAHVDALIGAAALIASDLDQQPYSILLDPRPDALKALEAESHRMRLHHTLLVIAELVGSAGARNPKTTGVQIVRDIDALEDGHERLKAALVEALGEMGRSAEGLPTVLPPLYGALTSRSQRVRAAAVKAYRELTSRLNDLDDLPPLLHETFLVLLGDPYVVVHQSAVRALREVGLPLSFCRRASSHLVNIVNLYATSKNDDCFLADALEAFVYLINRQQKMTQRLADQIVDILDGMAPSSAGDVIDTCGRSLQQAQRFPDCVIRLLGETSLTDYESERLARYLWKVPQADIRRLAPQLEAASLACRRGEADLTDDLLQRLSEARAWPAVENIAARVRGSFDDTRWNRGRRIQAGLRHIAAQIEMAASDDRLSTVPELQTQWSALTETVKDDEAREASE